MPNESGLLYNMESLDKVSKTFIVNVPSFKPVCAINGVEVDKVKINPIKRLIMCFKFKSGFVLTKILQFLCLNIVFTTLTNRLTVRNIAIYFVISVSLILISFQRVGIKQYKVRKIVIDPGHGGRDPGTHGLFSNEKDVVLKISLELKRILNENMPDVEVVLTRSDDSFPSLTQRSKIANDLEADLFISIHANWLSNPNVKGTETYVMGTQNIGRNFEVAKRENSVILLEENYEETYQNFDPKSIESYILFSLTQNAFHEKSVQFARLVEKQFKERVGRRSLGVKQSSLYLLWSTAMPSVLVEVGYLSNPKEEKYLNDKRNQVYIASGIYRAFKEYKNEIEQLN